MLVRMWRKMSTPPLLVGQTKSTYQILSNKKEGVDRGSGKAQSISVGKYQKREIFQLNSNYLCMGIIVFEGFFSKKSLILYIILCYSQFYHIYVRWQSSLLYENVSISLFNYIPIVFICLSKYLRFFKKSIL